MGGSIKSNKDSLSITPALKRLKAICLLSSMKMGEYEGEEEEEEEEEEYNDDDSNEKSAKKAAKRKLSVSNEDAPVKRKAGRPRVSFYFAIPFSHINKIFYYLSQKVQPAEGSAEKPPKKQKDVSQATSASSSAKSSSSEVPPPVASAAAALETSEERKDEKKAVVVKEPPAAAKGLQHYQYHYI